MASFALQDSLFLLVPGGEIPLGFNASDWRPTADERASWDDTLAEGLRLEPDLPTYLSSITTRPRTARRLSLNLCHAKVISHLQQKGFRLPTFEEWEYFCGAGERALFRWGDHVPCDRYPDDISPEDAQWRIDWVVSGGELDPPDEPFEPDWSNHRVPNAFGLMIANSPRVVEHLMEADQWRGGDGGVASCGGEGFFKGWLPLATAYRGERICHDDYPESEFPSVRKQLPFAGHRSRFADRPASACEHPQRPPAFRTS